MVGCNGKVTGFRKQNHRHCWVAKEWPEGGVNFEGHYGKARDN